VLRDVEGRLAKDLLDPGDCLVDRLLGADAVGGDAVDGFRPGNPPVGSGLLCRQSPEAAT
jgi:hypothetical protein